MTVMKYGKLESALLEVFAGLENFRLGNRDYGKEHEHDALFDDIFIEPRSYLEMTKAQRLRHLTGQPVDFGIRRKISTPKFLSGTVRISILEEGKILGHMEIPLEYKFTPGERSIKNTDVSEDCIDSLINQPAYEYAVLPILKGPSDGIFMVGIEGNKIKLYKDCIFWYFPGPTGSLPNFTEVKGAKDLLALDNKTYDRTTHQQLVQALKQILSD